MATKKNNLWWLYLSLGVVLVAILWGLMGPCNKPGTTVYIRDTTYLEKYRDTGSIQTKWKYIEGPTVTIYTESPNNGGKVIYKTDTLTEFDSFTVYKDKIVVRQVPSSFLVNWPNNPKLIRNYLKEDSIRYDFYYPNGKVTSKSYPVDYKKYTYTWENDSLKVVKAKLPFLKQLKGESYFYTLYDPFRQTPQLAVDYALRFRNVALYGKVEGQFTRPFLSTWVGARIQIK